MNFKQFQKSRRKQLMPTGQELAREAQDLLRKRLKTITIPKVQNNFNAFLKNLLALEFEAYKRYEKDCSVRILREAVGRGLLVEKESFEESLEVNYAQFWELFLSISNSRKARAGGSFENHVKYLFELLQYPFDTQTVLNGKVDYVVPSEQAFRKDRNACVVISIKRTLRERWRQVVAELSSTNAGKIYMLTADENISYDTVKEMANHNIYLVIWDEYKKEKFTKDYNVIGFTPFVQVHMPTSKKLWEKLM